MRGVLWGMEGVGGEKGGVEMVETVLVTFYKGLLNSKTTTVWALSNICGFGIDVWKIIKITSFTQIGRKKACVYRQVLEGISNSWKSPGFGVIVVLSLGLLLWWFGLAVFCCCCYFVRVLLFVLWLGGCCCCYCCFFGSSQRAVKVTGPQCDMGPGELALECHALFWVWC